MSFLLVLRYVVITFQVEPKVEAESWFVMSGFNENFVVLGEWLDGSPKQKKRSKAKFGREISLKKALRLRNFLQTSFLERLSYSRGGLSERIDVRACFNRV